MGPSNASNADRTRSHSRGPSAPVKSKARGHSAAQQARLASSARRLFTDQQLIYSLRLLVGPVLVIRVQVALAIVQTVITSTSIHGSADISEVSFSTGCKSNYRLGTGLCSAIANRFKGPA